MMGQLAAVMASTDAVPRLVRQSTTLFLVSPQGGVWRVFDSDDDSGVTRYAPSTDRQVRSRVFLGGGQRPAVRVYTFGPDEPRSIEAERLYEQLSASRLTTEALALSLLPDSGVHS